MFERFGRLAEQMASDAGQSRRGFLCGLGKAAVAATAALGGILLLPGAARAGHCFCYFSCNGNLVLSGTHDCTKCPASHQGCPLVGCNCGA
jgi:hypothetical protein